MLVQIDSREQDRIQSAKQYYEQQGLTVKVEELEVGDYLFDNKVCFEFKLINDFVSSIQSGRVFNQAISQSEEYPYHFVIIHGDLTTRSKAIAITKHYQPVSIFQYLSAIASLNRYTTVIETYSPYLEESYYRMLVQAQKCLKNKPIVKKFPRKHKNACFNYLAYCVYGVSAKRASDICHYLDIHTLEDLLNITHQQLTSIDGIGEKLADRIITTISNDTYD